MEENKLTCNQYQRAHLIYGRWRLCFEAKKLLYTVANPARGLLNREKKKKKVWQAPRPPPRPRAARSEKKKKTEYIIYSRQINNTRGILRRSRRVLIFLQTLNTVVGINTCT